ncbi:hypothetical protein DLM75_00835 [Leptospira stimsonii]|uniref:Uncharacterized protein n=1 Tax=Leptospira stimsonii TaxID=2202203 RepID=A0A396ZBA8_9LEPT|nr:hypothetical protein DLM75_00835 [Leptospira stimsonii]
MFLEYSIFPQIDRIVDLFAGLKEWAKVSGVSKNVFWTGIVLVLFSIYKSGIKNNKLFPNFVLPNVLKCNKSWGCNTF